MDSNKWNEKNVEKLLSEIPNIVDTRSKEEVMTQLKQDARLQKPLNNKGRRNKPTKRMVAFVGVAALLVLSLLLPSMLNSQTDKANEAADTMSVLSDDKREIAKENSDDASVNTTAGQEAESVEDASDIEESKLTNYESIEEVGGARFAVYPEDIVDSTVFHMGLAGDAASSVPVTFIIPQSQIEEDFGRTEPTSFDLYEKYATQIDEEALGFSDYHPYKGELAVEGETLVQILPNGHGYDTASATMETFSGTLQDTFYGYREIRFENEDGTIVEFDQVGEPSKPLQLTSGRNFHNYYLVSQGNGQEFLSSNFGKSYEELDVALEEMKVSPNDIYSTVIPSSVNFRVVEGEKVTIVKFDEPLDLQSMNEQAAMQMISGILLTAASFDVQLKFENVLQAEWNGFNFKEPLPIPVGSNLLPLLLK